MISGGYYPTVRLDLYCSYYPLLTIVREVHNSFVKGIFKFPISNNKKLIFSYAIKLVDDNLLLFYECLEFFYTCHF